MPFGPVVRRVPALASKNLRFLYRLMETETEPDPISRTGIEFLLRTFVQVVFILFYFIFSFVSCV
jgi:hypothetical protein